MNVDPVARTIGIVAVVISAVSFGRLLLADWKNRHRVTAGLKIGGLWTPGEQLSLAIITVTNVGRAMAVRDIVINWCDSRPSPRQIVFGPPGISSVSVEDAIGAVSQGPSAALGFHQLLADGESREWTYAVRVSPEVLDDGDEPTANLRKIRAVVTMANGKTVLTNEAYIRPGRLADAVSASPAPAPDSKPPPAERP